MVKIPTYERQVSVPASTGMTAAPLSMAETGTPQFMAKVSAELSDAALRIQNREDTINRVRDFSIFKTKVAEEWQSLQDTEDMSNPATLQKFNSFLAGERANLEKMHSGSENSRAVLSANAIDLTGQYERTALGAVRGAQIKMLQNQFGDSLNPILKGVSDGSVPVANAFEQLRKVSKDIGGALPKPLHFDMVEAAQGAIAMSAINRHLDIGDYENAEAELNRNPQFTEVLDNNQLSAIVRRIGEQKAVRNLTDQKVMSEMRGKANMLGYESWAKVPAALKFEMVMGRQPGGGAYKPTTDAAKAVMDRQALTSMFGEGSAQVRQFDSMIGGVQKPESEIGRLYADQQRLQAMGKKPGDPEYDAITNTIKEKDPKFVEDREKALKLAPAQIAMANVERQANSVKTNSEKALMLMTGTGSIEEAKKAVADGNLAFSMTGLAQKAAANYPGSDVAEVDGLLNQIRGNKMLDAMSNLKASSPTGASGLGALSEKEGLVLQSLEGSLSLGSPLSTARTLIQVIDATPSVIDGQRAAFNSAFGGGTGAEKKATAKEPSNAGTPKKAVYDLNGNRIQ
jgi:hypothetical protein